MAETKESTTMTTTEQDTPTPADLDMLEAAWGIIANAGGGNWQETQTAEWIEAAERWRDRYHEILSEQYPDA